MKCTAARELISRKIDSELEEVELSELDAHLTECASCSREYAFLSFPSRVAQVVSPPEPSPFFYHKLRTNIEGEAQRAAGWQTVFGLARQLVPALAGITLALLSVFAYFQMSGGEPDLYRAYDRVFISEEQPNRFIGEMTDESMMRAIAERELQDLQTR